MIDSYAKAGVNIKKTENALASISNLIKGTHNKNVISPKDSFAALYQINDNFVVAAATDGVGTKLDIAIETGIHKTIGIDLVAMVVNDLAVYGIKPLFFLDYMATSKFDEDIFAEVIEGIAMGCKKAGCALIGGETAEMPGFYPLGKYDLAGFAIGLANKDDLITGKKIKPGDVVLGLASSGLHSNGFSLVRKIIKDNNIDLSTKIDGLDLGNVLLEPTVVYSDIVQDLIKKVEIKGFAHITGGGFSNIERILPASTKAIIDKKSWEKPAVFSYLRKQGDIGEEEMYKVFNMGIGMVAIVDEDQVEDVKNISDSLKISVSEIGKIKTGNKEIELRA